VSRSAVLIVAAVAGGVLYVAGAVALGSPPTATDSPADVVAWFRDHHDAARTYAWTATFGLVGLVAWAARDLGAERPSRAPQPA